MRNSPCYFAIWVVSFCFVINVLILLIWAMRMGPNESSYNNGLGNILSLPFLAIDGLILVGLLCSFPKWFKWHIAFGVFCFYSVAAFAAYRTPSLYGGYQATFKIIDRAGNPIPSIRVDFLQQRSFGLLSVFFAQDFATTDYSNTEGLVHVKANIFTQLHGTINQVQGEPKPADIEFKIAEFTIMQDARGTIYQVSWAQPFGEARPGSLWSKNIQIPLREPLSVYLADKTDDGSYPGN